VPGNTDSTSPLTSRLRRARRPSLAPREAVLGLDSFERKISLVGAGTALIFALATVVEWTKNAATIVTQAPSKTNTCPNGYHLVKSLCDKVTHTSRGQWEVRFLFISIVALCILYFALRRKRAGVACFSIFLGLGLGVSTGLVFFFLGAWLIVRAYRLQKYGVASFFGSNRVAKEIGQTKRADRAARAASKGESTPATTKTTAAPTASKRYTPKKPPRRR
jgi:hypothetical protein